MGARRAREQAAYDRRGRDGEEPVDQNVRVLGGAAEVHAVPFP